MLQVIGKVSATEKMPSTIDNFYFWTDKGQILSPFDIVKVEHVSSNSDKSITYGVIEEITHERMLRAISLILYQVILVIQLILLGK